MIRHSLVEKLEKFEDSDKFLTETEHPIMHLWVINKGKNKIDNRVSSEIILKKKNFSWLLRQ